jgi:hypothetical protein
MPGPPHLRLVPPPTADASQAPASERPPQAVARPDAREHHDVGVGERPVDALAPRVLAPPAPPDLSLAAPAPTPPLVLALSASPRTSDALAELASPLTPASPRTGDALAELDALLAAPLDDPACARLAELAPGVPGRLRAVTAALGAAASAAAVDALLALPPGAPGQLDALVRGFARGVRRRLGLHPVGSAAGLAPAVLALEFRSSRARSFPDLIRRAQAIAAGDPAPPTVAEFEALDLHAPGAAPRRFYRLSFWADRAPRRAAALLRAVHLDLTWLHARLVRLRGTRLWLAGWHFADDHPLGPAAQAHLLQAWLRWAEQEPPA